MYPYDQDDQPQLCIKRTGNMYTQAGMPDGQRAFQGRQANTPITRAQMDQGLRNAQLVNAGQPPVRNNQPSVLQSLTPNQRNNPTAYDVGQSFRKSAGQALQPVSNAWHTARSGLGNLLAGGVDFTAGALGLRDLSTDITKPLSREKVAGEAIVRGTSRPGLDSKIDPTRSIQREMFDVDNLSSSAPGAPGRLTAMGMPEERLGRVPSPYSGAEAYVDVAEPGGKGISPAMAGAQGELSPGVQPPAPRNERIPADQQSALGRSQYDFKRTVDPETGGTTYSGLGGAATFQGERRPAGDVKGVSVIGGGAEGMQRNLAAAKIYEDMNRDKEMKRQLAKEKRDAAFYRRVGRLGSADAAEQRYQSLLEQQEANANRDMQVQQLRAQAEQNQLNRDADLAKAALGAQGKGAQSKFTETREKTSAKNFEASREAMPGAIKTL
jgi:hypothetical protein